MRTYELVCAFRMKEGQDTAGIEAVKKILGDRELAYDVDGENRARYRLFNVELEQDALPKIDEAMKLRTEILRSLLVLKD